MRRTKTLSLILLLLFVGLLLGSCAEDPVIPTDPVGYTNANGINGGRMYDKFWATETGFDSTKDVTFDFDAYKNFFRCKQCHGWDRLGNQGAYISRAPNTSRPRVAGVDLREHSAEHTPQELFDDLTATAGRRDLTADLSTYDPATNATVGDQMPNLNQIFSEAQIWDLVKFLKTEATDISDLYDFALTGTYPTGSITYSNIGAKGNAANGDVLFAARCAGCHGADGTQVLVDGGAYTVGRHLRKKPNEDHHKMKFGQLGTAMGSLVTNLQDLQDIYAALDNKTKYPDEVPPPAEYSSADGINGGRLYDRFWAIETGFNQSDPSFATYSGKSNFFRCKQCHGWDRLGNQGAYISRTPNTSRPRVAGLDLLAMSNQHTPQEMFDAISSSAGRRDPAADLSSYDPDTNAEVGDKMPDYSQILTVAEIWDLVKFLLEDAIDINDLYDFVLVGGYPTGTFTPGNLGKGGDATNGDAIYTAKCAGCHGTDGRLITVDGGYSVGSHLRAKPNEDQHKIKFGQLGSTMGSLVTSLGEMQDIYAALDNETKYPDP